MMYEVFLAQSEPPVTGWRNMIVTAEHRRFRFGHNGIRFAICTDLKKVPDELIVDLCGWYESALASALTSPKTCSNCTNFPALAPLRLEQPGSESEQGAKQEQTKGKQEQGSESTSHFAQITAPTAVTTTRGCTSTHEVQA